MTLGFCFVLVGMGASTLLPKVRDEFPEHNIYLGIPHNLLDGVDPTLEAATQRVQTALEQTFWANAAAFTCCQAAQALCKRFVNIDQFFFFWGPGGVGLSIYSAHVAAMYGQKNHKYFDPNIFYADDELRKQVELLV